MGERIRADGYGMSVDGAIARDFEKFGFGSTIKRE
jgi:hypothetical protein